MTYKENIKYLKHSNLKEHILRMENLAFTKIYISQDKNVRRSQIFSYVVIKRILIIGRVVQCIRRRQIKRISMFISIADDARRPQAT